MSPSSEGIGLDDAYGVDGPDQNRALYSRWAATYDETFVARMGYRYHETIAGIFVERGGQGPVLDVGCGTGAVGVELARLGIGPIDGIDISAEMLNEASAKTASGVKVFRTLMEADLTETIDVVSDTYRGVVSAGTFTHGHLGPEPLDELVRVASPGALLVIGINSAHFVEFGFDDWVRDAARARQIDSVDIIQSEIYSEPSKGDPDKVSNVLVARVL